MTYTIEAVLSFILLAALYMKATDYHNARYDVFSYGLIPYDYSKVTVGIVLGIEGSLAACFITSKFTTAASIVAVVLFTCFSLALLYKRSKQGASSCSCFGNMTWLNRMPLTRNVILIILASARAFMPERNDTVQSNVTLLLLIILFILTIDIVLAFKKGSIQRMLIS